MMERNRNNPKMREENPDAKVLFIEGLKELGKDPDPSKVTLRFASRGTTELSKKMAEWMKQTWEETLGITIEIDMMEWNIMWDRVDAGDYDIATAGWGPYYNEPSAIFGLFEPENGYFNADKTGWNDEDSKKFSELLASVENVTDPQEKAQIYLQLEEILVGGGIICPTYLLESPSFVSDKVEGYYVSTNGMTDFTQVSVTK